MREFKKRIGMNRKAAAMSVVAVVLLLLATACGGEDRPAVEVIDESGSASVSVSGTGSVSASVSGTGTETGSVSGTGTMTGTDTGMDITGPSEHYVPVSNVTPHAALSLDMRDIATLLQAAKTDETVDWAAITAIYENGANSAKSDGSFRSLAGYATSDSVLAEFPGGANLDANVRVGLTGEWQGRSLDDPTRRQLVNKALQAIIYGKVLQEVTAARVKVEAGNTDDASGAPHNVDEAWAFYVGTPDGEGSYPYSISSTARSREGNFGLEGKVAVPLEQALAKVLAASRSGDLSAFDAAAAEVRIGLNSIFYLATLRYAKRSSTDEELGPRSEHIAEGWAFFQPIHPAVRSASASAADSIEAFFAHDPAGPVSTDSVETVYAALNEAAVLEALGISAEVQVTSPEQAN